MAGLGQRFVNEGYRTPKPLIMVKGKTILEWTLESFPIQKEDTLWFAVLKKHQTDIEPFLYETYGSDIQIIIIDELTNGNLETVYICTEQIDNGNLIILDCDNKYNHNNIRSFIKQIPADKESSAVFHFKDDNRSLPNKWANLSMNDILVTEIREKDDGWVDKSKLIGIFYVNDISFLRKQAEKIFDRNIRTNNEYYTSSVFNLNLEDGYNVYTHEVKDVVPLGTPEDIKLFERTI